MVEKKIKIETQCTNKNIRIQYLYCQYIAGYPTKHKRKVDSYIKYKRKVDSYILS